MNNNQKLVQTIEKAKRVQRKYEREVKQQIDEAETYTQRHSLETKLLALEELNFPCGKPYVVFCSVDYGSYHPYIRNRRRRIQALSICFLVTLYEQKLQATFPKEDIQIPYDLRGFWKMQQAVGLMEDFVKFQNKSQQILLWEHRRLQHEGKAKAAEYFKILEEFLPMETKSCRWKKEITYHDMHFVMKTDNTKLDVVPLCKIFTKYYANVVMKINRYLKASASKAEEDKLVGIEEEFRVLMERYFVKIP